MLCIDAIKRYNEEQEEKSTILKRIGSNLSGKTDEDASRDTTTNNTTDNSTNGSDNSSNLNSGNNSILNSNDDSNDNSSVNSISDSTDGSNNSEDKLTLELNKYLNEMNVNDSKNHRKNQRQDSDSFGTNNENKKDLVYSHDEEKDDSNGQNLNKLSLLHGELSSLNVAIYVIKHLKLVATSISGISARNKLLIKLNKYEEYACMLN